MNEPAKSIFKSRTAAVSLLTIFAGAAGTVFPDLRPYLAENASAIMLCLGAVHFTLRLITHGRVVLFSESG
jgi:hypothetical protein